MDDSYIKIDSKFLRELCLNRLERSRQYREIEDDKTVRRAMKELEKPTWWGLKKGVICTYDQAIKYLDDHMFDHTYY